MAQDFDPQDIPVQEASIGGYECDLFLEFVETNLKCCKCKRVLREPHHLTCCDKTMIMCKSCIPNEEEPCSQCHQWNSTPYDEVTSERVMRLKVQCKHYKEECEWRGELGDLDEHLAHCQYRKLKCPYGCPVNISFCDLEVHKSDECILRPAEKKADTNSRKIAELRQDIEWLKQCVLQCPELALENRQLSTHNDTKLIDEVTQVKDRQTMFDHKIQEQCKLYDAKLTDAVANIEHKVQEQATKQTKFEIQLQKLLDEMASFEHKLQAQGIRCDKKIPSTQRNVLLIVLAVLFIGGLIALYSKFLSITFVATVYCLFSSCYCFFLPIVRVLDLFQHIFKN